KSGNKYFVMRHGEAESNVNGVVSSNVADVNHLTVEGKEQVRKAAESLKNVGTDRIIASPFMRTQETAAEVAAVLGLSTDRIVTDERIKEIDTGVFSGKNIKEYRAFFNSLEEKFSKTPERGENLADMKRRVGACLYDIEHTHSG